ncbi:hypothetical protein HL667_00105 [Bradyrhizobium sp. 83012]|uniref:Uncharacterized protein n=1 Tax=Bradyrhizobium aeschynomenes TaxID=2734909 RepID=A0ABX2C7P3_9BRAD|nr:hypothetical protein [Bradyrhizobium aeschynomenes]NPU63397.1 hypothetical protein [Bradyrhizobium aeschynomenes]
MKAPLTFLLPAPVWRSTAFIFGGVFVLSLAVLGSGAFAGDGAVTIPYGQWISDSMPLILAGLASLVTWGLRQLPANVVALFGNARVELLINNGIGYGLNAVKDAAKGKTLSVDVGNKVLAEAMQYAIENAPGWLLSWAGGPEGLAKKIFGRLDLAPDADATMINLATQLVKPSGKAGE